MCASGGVGRCCEVTDLVAGEIFALLQQRRWFDEEPSHDAHDSESGASAAAAAPSPVSGGACSWRSLHVRMLVDTAAVPGSSRQATAVPRAPLYTSMYWHVFHWPLADAAHRTLHSPLPLLPAGYAAHASVMPLCAQPGQKMSASFPQLLSVVPHVKRTPADASPWTRMSQQVKPLPPVQMTWSVSGCGGPWMVISRHASCPEHVSVQSWPSSAQVRSVFAHAHAE